jgi:hypothetical protein
MNIKQSKEQIQNAMKAYFTKDGFGNYLIPIERQRNTAFVFVDDNYNNPDVPPWAIKLILQKDEI